MNSLNLIQRTRRLRLGKAIREGVAETSLHSKQLIKPVFVTENKEKILLPNLPDSAIYPIADLLKEVERLMHKGILGINLYPNIDVSKKDMSALEALNPDGLIPRAIEAVKRHFPECLIIPDIALDPYTVHGHDGLIDGQGEILNDESVALLAQQSLLYAQAGADIVAPSDMFDGRTRAIRQTLDAGGYHYVAILAYAAKYASAYYGPFRAAVGSDRLEKLDKRSYQIEPANVRQALAEIQADLDEGADIIMIKPAGHYLDIVAKARQITQQPIAVFQVSGECAMIKLAAQAGLIDEREAVLEKLISMRRAGADLIFTYYAEIV